MTKQGRVSAPGRLSGPVAGGDSAATTTAEPENTLLPGEPLRDLALRHGLKQTAVRPPLRGYAAELWQRRYFISGFATARNIAMYTEARLGQLWQVLTPLLNAGVYYLIFGLLLNTSRGVPDYISFLVTGIFVFNFTQRAFITSSQVIRDTLPLIRALYFPRACLPLGYVLIELQQLILSFAVLFVIILIRGEPPTPYWLLIFPILALQSVFNVGAGLILARWGAGFDDVSQLLPFIVRTWLYVSGVLFSLQSLSLKPAAAQSPDASPTCCRSTRPRSTSRWSGTRCWGDTGTPCPGPSRSTPITARSTMSARAATRASARTATRTCRASPPCGFTARAGRS